MDRAQRDKMIEQYEQGYQVVVDALEGITEAGLDCVEAPGEWSPREVVHHLADSEMTAAIRLRRLIAEDDPMIQGYDQEEFARRLYYDRPIEASVEALKSARRTTGEILARMTDAEWSRQGTHSELHGPYTVERWLEIYAPHAHDHAAQIKVARAAARRKN
jgi:hypothetical protein